MYSHLHRGNMNNKRRETKKSFSPPLKVNSYKVKEDLDSSSRVQTTTKAQHHVITEDQKRSALRHYPALRSERDLASASRVTELD